MESVGWNVLRSQSLHNYRLATLSLSLSLSLSLRLSSSISPCILPFNFSTFQNLLFRVYILLLFSLHFSFSREGVDMEIINSSRETAFFQVQMLMDRDVCLGENGGGEAELELFSFSE